MVELGYTRTLRHQDEPRIIGVAAQQQQAEGKPPYHHAIPFQLRIQLKHRLLLTISIGAPCVNITGHSRRHYTPHPRRHKIAPTENYLITEETCAPAVT